MTVAEFVPWAMAQPRGRYELVGGEVVAEASERARHNLAKLAVARTLQDAVRKAGVPCTVFTDGMTLKIDEFTAREPDAAVQCGIGVDLDSVLLEAPLIVVEVVSPSSERDNTGSKLVEYFSVASIQHYLIVNAQRSAVIHHRRGTGDEIVTRILTDGSAELDPPGLVVPVAEMLATG